MIDFFLFLIAGILGGSGMTTLCLLWADSRREAKTRKPLQEAEWPECRGGAFGPDAEPGSVIMRERIPMPRRWP